MLTGVTHVKSTVLGGRRSLPKVRSSSRQAVGYIQYYCNCKIGKLSEASIHRRNDESIRVDEKDDGDDGIILERERQRDHGWMIGGTKDDDAMNYSNTVSCCRTEKNDRETIVAACREMWHE